MNNKTRWINKSFQQLTPDELYDLLKLRSDIFVVEQNCIYPDSDSERGSLDRHKETIHLLGYAEQTIDENPPLVAYLRILTKGQSYPEHISIGRVVTANSVRGNGLGHELLQQGIELCNHHFPLQAIKISAQEHLKAYYQTHGFKQISAMYLEDGIPHISMIKLPIT